MRHSSRRLLSMAALVSAVAVLALVFAGAAEGGWKIEPVGGNAFSGTYVNDTGHAVNTAGWQTTDPITSLTFDNSSCIAEPDGTAACDNFATMDPGASATFHGTTRDPVRTGQVFSICVDSLTANQKCDNVTVSGAAAPTRLAITVAQKQYEPTRATIAWNATVTVCNDDPFYAYPFSFSPAGKYTTMLYEKEPAEGVKSYYLPVPKSTIGPHTGRRLLAPPGKPGHCGTFRVHNTSGQTQILKLFDAIHSRAKMTLTIDAKPRA